MLLQLCLLLQTCSSDMRMPCKVVRETVVTTVILLYLNPSSAVWEGPTQYKYTTWVNTPTTAELWCSSREPNTHGVSPAVVSKLTSAYTITSQIIAPNDIWNWQDKRGGLESLLIASADNITLVLARCCKYWSAEIKHTIHQTAAKWYSDFFLLTSL